MPKSLTDSAAFTSPVAVPLGSEPRTAGSVETPFQALANRTYYLQQLAEVGGVGRIKTVADVSALNALDDSGMSVGELRLVPGFGVYRLTTGTGDDSPWRIESATGTRLWIHVLESLRGASDGLATLSGGRVVEKPANAIVARGYVANLAARVTTSSTYGDISGSEISLPGLLAGDIVTVEGVVLLYSAAQGNSYVQAMVSEAGGSYSSVTESIAYGGPVADMAAAAFVPICFDRTVSPSGAGTYAVKLQSKAANNSTSSAAQVMSLRATVVRP